MTKQEIINKVKEVANYPEIKTTEDFKNHCRDVCYPRDCLSEKEFEIFLDNLDPFQSIDF